MKKFIFDGFHFLIPLVFFFYINPFYLLIGDKYKSTVAGWEIYFSINKSKQKSKCKKLIIGDSVARQLFSNTDKNDSINSLACNQAIGVIGQYFLLRNYLRTGNRPDEVYMVYSPFSFKNNLDQVYTFHYFLKPFYKKEYLDQFSNHAINQIDKIPFSNFCHEPYVLTSNWAPDFKCKDTMNYSFLSPLSIEYLIRIKKLCDLKDIEFYIIPAPSKESNKGRVAKLDKGEFLGLNVEHELNYFLNNIYFLADSLFIDDLHLKKPKIVKSNVLSAMNKARINYNKK